MDCTEGVAALHAIPLCNALNAALLADALIQAPDLFSTVSCRHAMPCLHLYFNTSITLKASLLNASSSL